MPFKKNNEYGKHTKRGEAKKTKELKVLMTSLFEKGLQGAERDMDELDAKERLDFLAKIAPYVLPKLQSTTITADEDSTAQKIEINFKNANIDELTKLINSTPASDTKSSDTGEG